MVFHLGGLSSGWCLIRVVSHQGGLSSLWSFIRSSTLTVFTQKSLLLLLLVPVGSPSCGGDVSVYVWRKPTALAHSFLFCSCVYFCLYGPFNCISFHKFSWQLSTFSLCFSCLILALLVLSTIYFLIKVSISPDIILCVWLGLKHQLTNTEQANILFCAWLPSW